MTPGGSEHNQLIFLLSKQAEFARKLLTLFWGAPNMSNTNYTKTQEVLYFFHQKGIHRSIHVAGLNHICNLRETTSISTGRSLL